RRAPLTYGPVFYLKYAVEIASRANMQDALLEAVDALKKILLATKIGIDTQTAENEAIGVLWSIALVSYVHPDSVLCFPAVQAMLMTVAHELDMARAGNRAQIKDVLRKIALLVPAEVTADKAGKRLMQTFPPYSLAFEGNLAALLERVGRRV